MFYSLEISHEKVLFCNPFKRLRLKDITYTVKVRLMEGGKNWGLGGKRKTNFFIRTRSQKHQQDYQVDLNTHRNALTESWGKKKDIIFGDSYAEVIETHILDIHQLFQRLQGPGKEGRRKKLFVHTGHL